MPRTLFVLLLIVSLGAVASVGLVSSWQAACDDTRAACVLASSFHPLLPARSSPDW